METNEIPVVHIPRDAKHVELLVETWTTLEPSELPFRLTQSRPRLEGCAAAIFHPKPAPASDLAQRFNRGETHCNRCALAELARSFPSLSKVDIFVEPHSFDDGAQIVKRIAGGGHGYQCAMKFVAHVWNPQWASTLKPIWRRFDVSEALACWDAEHRQAFANWAANPWWP